MTQVSLFDHQAPPETLPAQGRTPEARVAGELAAVSAAGRRGRLALRYPKPNASRGTTTGARRSARKAR